MKKKPHGGARKGAGRPKLKDSEKKQTFVIRVTKEQLEKLKKEMNNQPYPKGTTKEQWEQYYEALKVHYERVKRERPDLKKFLSNEAYTAAYSEWQMMSSCDAPNKPGYYRANND